MTLGARDYLSEDEVRAGIHGPRPWKLKGAARKTIEADVLRRCLTEDLHVPQVSIHGGVIQGPLDLSWCHVAAAVTLRDCEFQGPVDLCGARIAGNVDLSESVFTLPHGWEEDATRLETHHVGAVIRGDRLETAGSLRLFHIRTSGRISIAGAKIGSQLVLRASQLSAGEHREPEFGVLVADRIFVGGSAFLDSLEDLRFTADHTIRLPGSTINGNLALSHAYLGESRDDELHSLVADQMFVGGDLWMEGMIANGPVSLPAAKIGGRWRLHSAVLRAGGERNRRALVAHGVTVGNGLAFSPFDDTGPRERVPFCAHGEVDLNGATVTGGIQATRTSFAALRPAKLDKTPTAISANRMVVHGNVQLDSTDVVGKIELRNASITGNLDLGSALIKNLNSGQVGQSGGLHAENCVVGNTAFFNKHPQGDRPFTSSGSVRLTSANIRCLNIHAPENTRWLLHGITFDHLRGPISRHYRTGLRWLAQRGKQETPIAVYGSLATFYERSGMPDDAKKVRYEAQRLMAKSNRWRIKRWAALLIGFGYYPLRIIVTLALLVLFCAGIVAATTPHFESVVDVPVISSSAGGDQPIERQLVIADDCPESVACLVPLAFGANQVIPAVNFADGAGWHLREEAPWWLRLTLAVLKSLGWVATTVFVAGLGALLRRS